MCFVSYLPMGNGFLLGSNRDEHKDRTPALSPALTIFPTGKVILPRDGKAGGTWIAVREDGCAAVLLNGALKNHVASPPYRQSRGIFIPALMQETDPDSFFSDIDLSNIEPFTLIIARSGVLSLWRWDGMDKSRERLNPGNAYCWSSATLYDPEQQALRAGWYQKAIRDDALSSAETLMEWHSKGGYGPADFDIVLTRPNGIRTVSTTVIDVNDVGVEMHYSDYLRSSGPFAERQRLSLQLSIA